ncbi:patatin-like phospholipase family protein [Noviherbaspirillum sedimenti]|uniref:Patatin-like phospholipase family protein n=1 Tax=Noviherbaspirillum sedimenti TaxID=2320865 RepID=A0A3A3FXT2_9BURK|nr:patatin-like phospholipase family protein [Noviherbaspirillum sedimenti]RJG01003.1 patatin-like phospholipase family protein [Noviherbaspirillum sedimenti]
MSRSPQRPSKGRRIGKAPDKPALPGQVVLVLQGGGALGAYQAGVYEALHEAGIEPDWLVGTSIGAINSALIAGNPPARRLQKLRAFWQCVEQNAIVNIPDYFFPGVGTALANWMTVMAGIPGFFTPNPVAWCNQYASLGLKNAAYYSTQPLRSTLEKLLDFRHINDGRTRMSLGAVNVGNGEMRYFDSRKETITMDHIMASSAYPPAFPAVRIDGDSYWDGGIYSNTPIEAVLDDNPRRDSLIFAVDVWNPGGAEPQSLWEVAGREKEILYASRADSHIARQKQIHHLRHVIRELTKAIPPQSRSSPKVRELASWGCHTIMHVVRLVAGGIDGEDEMKDIDFTPESIRNRWRAGYADTAAMLHLAPWTLPVDPIEGVVIHDALSENETSLSSVIRE